MIIDSNKSNITLDDIDAMLELPATAELPASQPKTPREIDAETDRQAIADLAKKGLSVVEAPINNKLTNNANKPTVDNVTDITRQLKIDKLVDQLEKQKVAIKTNKTPLIPKHVFPNTLTDIYGNVKILDHYENFDVVLTYYEISVKYDVYLMQMDITIANLDYIKIPEGFKPSQANGLGWKIDYIEGLLIANGMPTDRLMKWLAFHAELNQYNRPAELILSKPWDGVSRRAEFKATIKAKNEPLKDMLIDRWMLGLVEAVFTETGFFAAGVLVLQGDQGLGKTSWGVNIMPEGYRDLVAPNRMLDPYSKDSIINCTSHAIVELGELDGMFSRNVMAGIKGHITATSNRYRPAYARVEITVPRRTIYFATVNSVEFLVDDTGNRRWWTIACVEVNPNHSLDMQQVLAEYKYMRDQGEQYHLTYEENKLLGESNTFHEPTDPMEDALKDCYCWEDTKDKWRNKFTIKKILEDIGYDTTKGDSRKLSRNCGTLLRKLTGGDYEFYEGKKVFSVPVHRSMSGTNPTYKKY